MAVDAGTIVLGLVLDTLSGRSPLYRLEEFLASIMASATPFFFCTTQKHLTVKSV